MVTSTSSTPSIYARQAMAERYFQRLQDRPDRALSLFGPRQIGKTTFLNHDLGKVASAAGLKPLYVDLMLSKSPLKSINAALADELHILRSRKLKQPVKSIGLLGANVAMEPSPVPPQSTDDAVQMRHLTAQLLAQSGVRGILLMLDEFQEMTRLGEAGVDAIRAIRALFNQYKTTGQFLLLMTGSSQSELVRLFASPALPSFGLADREDFQPLGLDYVNFVVARANTVRAKGAKLDVAQVFDLFIDPLQNRPADLEAFLGFAATHAIATKDLSAACQQFLASRYTLLQMMASNTRQLMGSAAIQEIERRIGVSVTAGGIRKALVTFPPSTVSNPSRGVYEIEDKSLEMWLKAQDLPTAF
jgi:hypothetical protein